ncbi:Apoptogenic protein 1, mitochondrial [Dispira simplex]|nr:Apoptogenic protein 1, mitochondrial [Dispira simplex]
MIMTTPDTKPSANYSPDTPLQPGQMLISSPDPVSQCQLIKLYRPPHETPAQREYRELREHLQYFHHEFWSNNNTTFSRMEAEFITKVQTNPEIPVDDFTMLKFYGMYSDQARARYLEYSRQWWQFNLRLLKLGFRAWLDSWRK